jgi:hypothetical protein
MPIYIDKFGFNVMVRILTAMVNGFFLSVLKKMKNMGISVLSELLCQVNTNKGEWRDETITCYIDRIPVVGRFGAGDAAGIRVV